MNDRTHISRRDLLATGAYGLGSIALTALLAEEAAAGQKFRTHFPPKVKRVIQIFCCGGVSHIDTFDYKPELERQNGKTLTSKGKIDTFFGEPGTLMASPFAFKQHGKSGLWASDLLPHLAECVDDLTFIYSMKAISSNHTPATFQMNSGFTMNGFPTLGSWLSYGLGTMNEDLPTFVVLPDPRQLPAGGSINWTSGFLPATHQGVAFRTTGDPIPSLATPADARSARGDSAALLAAMNKGFAERNPGDSALSARVRAYELAARMQTSVPEAVDLEQEPEHIRKMYGLDVPAAAPFGRNCIMARRLLERGVRFVQVFNGGAFSAPRVNWDAHEDLVSNHKTQAATMDQPVAALLKDLKQRGMLHDTLILWTTEFGRTPITQGLKSKGRDHHHHGYTIWMAGGGLKPGFGYGATDDVGYYASENPVSVYDFHATVLKLLGIDHKRLTFYHNGIQRRLTDVHGEIIDGILA